MIVQTAKGGDLVMMTSVYKINSVMADPCTHDWLRKSIRALTQQDPVDAARDAEILAELMRLRCQEILAQAY